MEHSLLIEKTLDKMGNKYEALVRMSIVARKLTDGQNSEQNPANDKITTAAVSQYLKDRSISVTETEEQK